MLKKLLRLLSKSNIYLIAIIFIGTLTWSLTMVKSGILRDYGVGFWGPNGHDGIWHIAVIESLARGSWGMPVFAGDTFRNYHVGFDLITAIIHKLTFIPVPVLYFQILPVVLALLIGFYCYKFVSLWTGSPKSAFWSTFFVYFGGSFGWLANLIRYGNFDGESLFWSAQSISTLVNPPFALSILIIFVALLYLTEGKKENDKKKLMIATFLFGVLIQVKVYAGLLILGSLFCSSIWEVFKKQNFTLLKIFTGALIISILVFFPLNTTASSQIIWQPLWFLENMMALTDRLGWLKFHSAMTTYRFGHIYLKAIVAYSAAFAIFVIGNFGTRFISLIWFIKKIVKYKEVNFVELLFGSMVIAGVIIPMFVVQSGSPWNTIQFIYYSLIFSGVLSGIVIGEWLNSKKSVVASIVASLIILITIPTSIATLTHHYLPIRPPAKISKEELEALKFLAKQTDGFVLTYPFDINKAKEAAINPPRPLYLYDSTAYVSAYSKKDIYLEDEVNLDITGYDWKTRRDEELYFYDSLDHGFVREFLLSNDINYVYWLKGQRARLGESQLGLNMIFENEYVTIYKVQK